MKKNMLNAVLKITSVLRTLLFVNIDISHMDAISKITGPPLIECVVFGVCRFCHQHACSLENNRASTVSVWCLVFVQIDIFIELGSHVVKLLLSKL
jgi:hypothetical protein